MNSRHRTASRKTLGLAVLAGLLVIVAAAKNYIPAESITAIRGHFAHALGLSQPGRTPAYVSSYSGLPVPFDVGANDKDNPFLKADIQLDPPASAEPPRHSSPASQSAQRRADKPVAKPAGKQAGPPSAQAKDKEAARQALALDGSDKPKSAEAKEVSVWEAMSDTSGLHIAAKDKASIRESKSKSRAPASIEDEEHDLFIDEMGLTEAQYEVYKREKAKLKEKLQVADQLQSSGYEKAQAYRSVLLKSHRNWVKKFIGAENFRLYQDYQDQQEL